MPKLTADATFIASAARQSSALAQPLDCRVAALLAMTSSLRAFADSCESNPRLGCALMHGVFSREGATTRREAVE
jgi:hypothetical protein